jgi:exodeoxyribonuclease V gamma subunit
MAVRSRVGDRTRRDDDRFMFLEALLAAREVLLISHVGRHIRDNSVIPPSVLVGELLDYLDRAFRPTPPAASVRDQLTTVHPLQPFSERYFTGSEKESGRLFSYSSIWCAAGRSRRAAGPSVFQPFAEPLPAPPAETAADIALDDFCRFFRKPVAELLNRRLGIRIAEDEEEPEDEEPFALSPLDRYHIYTRILDELPADRATEEYLAQFRAEGILPAGPAGRNALERVHATVRSFGAQVTALRQGTSRRLPVDVCLAAPALRLRGELTDIFPAAMIVVRCGVLRAADQLEAWIRHLARLTVEPDGATICLGFVSNADGIKIETVQFKPVASPAGVLATLARLYQEGQVEPLRLFPESACVYAAEWMQSHDRTRALQRARSKWSSNYGHGERELNARLYQYVFRGADELDPRFEEIARTVFEPLLAATK